MIHGIGIDIVDISRFKAAMERRKGLCQRLFTGSELSYCLSRKRPERHLAARFAAKMSLFKALGFRFRFTQIEITRDSNGRPGVKGLEGRGFRVNISITHDGDLSLAETIVERNE